MEVVIIGSGNVATVMGGKIVAAGHRIVQVVARRAETAAVLAREWECGFTTEWSQIAQGAGLYIVCVSDAAIHAVNASLRLPGRLVVHTAGAVTRAALAAVSDRCGVLYPLQSLRSDVRPFPEFPLLIDAAAPADLDVLETFARSIARRVQRAGDGYRSTCHVAAVLVNNFSNYLYTAADDLCRGEEVDFSLLLPIIRETAARLEHYAPKSVQTGPAIRGDAATIARHLEILAGHPAITALYELFSAQIAAYYRI